LTVRDPDEKRPRASANRYGEMFEAVRRDPDFRLRMFLHALATSGNPYYAWQALGVCLEHKKEIPELLAGYLAQCIERMGSDRARQANDLREVLPWVFDFSKKAGPGNLLDPDRPDPDDKELFALKFATKIEQGEKLSTALMSACEEVLGQERAEKIAEKTLKSWLVKVFDLKKWPSRATADDWKRITRQHFVIGEAKKEALIEEHFRRIRKQSRDTPF
jgi:hypothetical protein